jgi:hypothetical protein
MKRNASIPDHEIGQIDPALYRQETGEVITMFRNAFTTFPRESHRHSA